VEEGNYPNFFITGEKRPQRAKEQKKEAEMVPA